MTHEFPSSTVVSRLIFPNNNNSTNGSPPSSQPWAYQRVHWVTIDERPQETEELRVSINGKNQYECILKRRAIRKRDDLGGGMSHNYEIPKSIPSSTHSTVPIITTTEFQNYVERMGFTKSNKSSSCFTYTEEEEVEGDTSLGMKLTILGGRVIVQNVIPLEDGRASPAQLTGLISRGDVLLAVDGHSLVGLGNIERLVDRLKPLSTPMDEQGNFQRCVRLQFEIGLGFTYLEREEQQQKYNLEMERHMPTAERIDAAEDLFNLSKFTFVDQWSGMPLYEDTTGPTTVSENNEIQNELENNHDRDIDQEVYIDTDNDLVVQDRMILDVRGMISLTVAEESELLRKMRLSAFFTMDDTFSCILKQEVTRSIRIRPSQMQTLQEALLRMNDNQLMEMGEELVHKAQADYEGIEKQLREMIPVDGLLFKRAVWKAYHDSFKDFSSIDSKQDYGDIIHRFEYLDDEGMLEIVANNHLWKGQLLKAIQSKWLDKGYQGDQNVVTNPSISNKESSHGGAITDHLHTLLFGSQEMKRLQDNKMIPFPPTDLTLLIYTIVKQLSLFLYPWDWVQSEHDSKHVKNGNHVTVQSTIVQGYLFDDLIPNWLHTFVPVKNENRWLVFPLAKDINSEGLSEHGTHVAPSSQGKKIFSSKASKGSSAMNEWEVDPNVRHQTCYLVTIYFIRKILGNYQQLIESGGDRGNVALKFIEKYGAYLNLRDSLIRAQAMNTELILSALLEVAQYDPYHVETLKKMTRRVSDLVYDPQMLSAIYSYLKGGKFDINPTKTLLTKAFPDIHPCQVRQLLPINQKQGDLYYEYLSSLMDPDIGHTYLQKDALLVREWCILSVSPRRVGFNNNFLKIASKALGFVQSYHRDLSFLLETSINIQYFDISLDLCFEILHDPVFHQYDETLIASSLHTIAAEAIKKDLEQNDQDSINFSHFTPLLQLYHDIQSSSVEKWRHVVVIKNELSNIFYLCSNRSKMADTEVLFLMLIAKSFPYETLEILSEWDTVDLDEVTGRLLFQLLQQCVRSGLEEDWGQKSLSLLEKFSHSKSDSMGNGHALKWDHRYSRKESLWDRVLQGKAIINK